MIPDKIKSMLKSFASANRAFERMYDIKDEFDELLDVFGHIYDETVNTFCNTYGYDVDDEDVFDAIYNFGVADRYKDLTDTQYEEAYKMLEKSKEHQSEDEDDDEEDDDSRPY